MPLGLEELIMTMPLAAPRGQLAAPTKAFLAYLQKHPDLRNRIRAAPGRTIA